MNEELISVLAEQGFLRGLSTEHIARLAEVGTPTSHEVVIFSIADCLRGFLPEGFEEFYNDGHLTCYRRE